MAFDYSKLKGRITEKFGTQKAFAEALVLSQNSMTNKLKGNTPITTDDIRKWSKPEFLDIDADKIGEYFFKVKVQED